MVYIYALELKQGKYYIGKTSNPNFLPMHDWLNSLTLRKLRATVGARKTLRTFQEKRLQGNKTLESKTVIRSCNKPILGEQPCKNT